MNVKNFLTLYAVVIMLYGILFLFLTSKAIGMYGAEDSALLDNAIKGIGSVFVAAGVMAWIARDANASYGRKAILAFIGLGSLIFVIRGLMALGAGAAGGQMTYIDLTAQIIFTIGGIYFFTKEKDF